MANIISSRFFSIVLPVYNGENYLDLAIKSILSQDFLDFELIIVDDGSTDESLKIAQKYQSKDSRILIIENPMNLSLPESLNAGHRKASGNYITWTSHDNILKPHFLKSFYNDIQLNDSDVLFSNFDIIDDEGNFKREHIAGPANLVLLGNYIGASFVYKKEVYEKLKGYKLNLFLVEDHDFFLRGILEFKFSHLKMNLFQYRVHPKSLTNKIQKNIEYSQKFKETLYNMYNDLDISLHHCTIDFIVRLYFKEEVLNLYLDNRKSIRKDFCFFEEKLMHKEEVEILDHLEHLVRHNWLNYESSQGFRYLYKVIIGAPELLFRKAHNKNASIRIIYSSFTKLFS